MSGCSLYPKTNFWMHCRNTLMLLLGLTAGFIFPNVSAAPVECTAPRKPDRDCGQHNMMLVGEETVFASHLPMFDSEHRFQLILEVKLEKGDENLNSIYTRDRKEHLDVRMYTLQPSKLFVLARLFGADEGSRLRSFPASVFRGHLERLGNKKLNQLSDSDVAVERIVYAAEIGRPNGPDRTRQLEYIVFGKGKDTFVAHRITQAPDFDQLLRVEFSGRGLTDNELSKGLTIVIPDRPNDAKQRLRQGDTVNAEGHVGGGGPVLPLQVTVIGEPYFEEGELAAPPTFDPTRLELEAGFGD
jgi:hypothetical protein